MRRADALASLGDEITAVTGRRAFPLALDLADPGAATELKTRLEDADWTVDTLVNCVGVGLTSPFTETAAADIEMQLQLNTRAVAELSHTFLPGLLASGRGALVNVGSLTGYMRLIAFEGVGGF